MGKKDKKNKQKQQKAVSPKQEVITPAIVSDANESIDKAKEARDSVPQNEVDVAGIEAQYVTDGSVSTETVAKLKADLEKETKILIATQRAYEDLKKKISDADKIKKQAEEDAEKTKKQAEEDAEKTKKQAEEDAEKKKQELAEMRNSLNERELKLIADEEALKVGDHSGVIERLITAFRNHKEEVIIAAEAQIKEQASVANDYLEKLNNVTAKETQLANKEKELRILERKVKTMEEVIDDERNEMRQEINEEIRNEFQKRLDNSNEEVNLYKGKLEKANEDVEKLKDALGVIQSAFGDVEPEVMASMCNKLKQEIDNLNQELASRPHQNDLDTKQKEVDLLSQDLIELRQKFNETEYLELKKMFDNNDTLIRDKQLLIDQIESAKAREINLRDTIDDLRRTINEINERHNKDNAFKASSKYDTGDYQVPMVRATAPASLHDFICYLQSFMATPGNIPKSKDGLRYSKDTIKKFIAGLYMSPISILQGISGTGKTSLPEAVAIAMTAADPRYGTEKGNDELQQAPYRICPIQSGWRDKMDLMGFYNSFEKSYHETEFFNALYLANQPKYEHCLFFIVLDEMNLSRPEHYFADFLSKLEMSEDQRKIKIDNVPEDICPKNVIGGTILIPKNVRFIGTANHDETTLEFAPKTYDRSNVIEMPRNAPKDFIPSADKTYTVTYTWLSKQFENAVNSHVDECEVFEKFIKDEELLNLLAKQGIGIGNRFEGQAKRFISVFVEAGDDALEDTLKAADHLMTTRILRTLKDNYDLSYDALDTFKKDYISRFNKYFIGNPQEAIDLFDKELDKKKKQ